MLILDIRELKQPRRQRKRKPHKFAYLTMKNSIFARFARAFFIFWHFVDVLVLSTTWNDLFCSCVDDVSIWWQMFNFVFSCPKRWFQFNSRIVRTHFLSIMSLTNWKMIAETRSHIFTWRSRFRRRRICLSSLLKDSTQIAPCMHDFRSTSKPIPSLLHFAVARANLLWNTASLRYCSGLFPRAAPFQIRFHCSTKGLFTRRESAPARRVETWLAFTCNLPNRDCQRAAWATSCERPLSTRNKMADQKIFLDGKFNFVHGHGPILCLSKSRLSYSATMRGTQTLTIFWILINSTSIRTCSKRPLLFGGEGVVQYCDIKRFIILCDRHHKMVE